MLTELLRIFKYVIRPSEIKVLFTNIDWTVLGLRNYTYEFLHFYKACLLELLFYYWLDFKGFPS